MRLTRSRWLATVAALATTAALVTAVPAAGAAAAAKPAAPAVRVNQVGYTPKSSKVAFAMLPAPVSSVRFAVIGSHGVVYRGRSTDDVGRWNKNYRAVYELNFSALCRYGSYRIELLGSDSAQSPPFRIASPAALYHQLVLNAVRYYTSERDGGDVVSWTASPPTSPTAARTCTKTRATTTTTTCSAS
jgi:endoglucanase